jgi:excisionase family DNA binding protein
MSKSWQDPPERGPEPEARPRFLTVAEVAGMMRVDPMTLYRAIRADEFPAVKIRGRYVIPARALDEMERAALASGAKVNAADWAQGRRAAA